MYLFLYSPLEEEDLNMELLGFFVRSPFLSMAGTASAGVFFWQSGLRDSFSIFYLGFSYTFYARLRWFSFLVGDQ